MANVLITGANRGIGLAFVRAYLNAGHCVIAACRAPEQAASLHELRSQYGENLTILAMDVTNSEQIAACAAEVRQRFGALHVLINNAGILRPSSQFADITAQDLMDSFQVNAIAPVLVAQAFADLLAAGAPSTLVNITMPTPPISKWWRTENQIYVTSRYALNALTKMMSLELIRRGIITVGMYPGYIQTDMNNYSEQAAPADAAIPPLLKTIEALTPDQNGMAILPNGQQYEW
jgi:NAD(P)-dependent dehydrogenase (short-subunit alcohol dehydrogenase family)